MPSIIRKWAVSNFQEWHEFHDSTDGKSGEALCTYQCYAPLPPVRAIVGQGGDLINLHINKLPQYTGHTQ